MEGDGLRIVTVGDAEERRVVVQGELDIATVESVRAAIRRAARPGRTVKVDLRRVSFVDSAGVRLLMEARDRAEQEGWKLLVLLPPPPYRHAFEVLGAERFLPIVES